MFDAIAAGSFPEWDFAVQLFTQEETDKFPFDHLDATRLIPEEVVPLKVIGRMVLDRWPDNVFAETEQVALLPRPLNTSATPYQPKHDGNDEHQTKNAAKPGPAIEVVGIIATPAAEQ